MILAKVTGNVVSTHKNKELIGEKLLIVHPIDLEGNLIGNKDMIAIDQIDSGIGDVVLVTKEGDAVQQILGHANAPVNTIIVSVVDNIDLINEV
ncbi:MAG: EutN/CcmL family microcompartment protein [Melioribacteraceae bacterium]|jgi:microcompartment protein CcmK/EutM|nr:ethanolamine utilization protein EutN [Ignavibacteriota bacterium]MBZ0181272.1 EutN/CcmL family microcompartment protein [Melioribacteraceae bacterium]